MVPHRMSDPERPFLNSYWVVPGRLLAGEYPGDRQRHGAVTKLRRVLAAGITYFLDLTAEEDDLEPYAPLLADAGAPPHVVHSRRTIRDLGCPSEEDMRAILDELDSALDGGHVVYLHCWGGIGRTGTVVGCHLVRSGMNGEEALDRVARLYGTMSKEKLMFSPHSPQTERQREFVRKWSENGR
jgi:hypothetical protein